MVIADNLRGLTLHYQALVSSLTNVGIQLRKKQWTSCEAQKLQPMFQEKIDGQSIPYCSQD
jgi:hypothetical protein